MCCCTGEDCSVLPWSWLLSVEGLSSSLNVKQWHTELWLLGVWSGCCAAVVSGMVGLKEMFHTCQKHGKFLMLLLRGVGLLKIFSPTFISVSLPVCKFPFESIV